MGWPYEFVTLNDEQKHLRRQSLDFYAAIAHYSLIVPLVAVILTKLLRIGLRNLPGAQDDGGLYQRVPGSPIVKAHRGRVGSGLAVTWRKFAWWMGDDVVLFGQVWGQRDEWVLGSVWLLWLLTLSVVGTGKDFLHLTKRLGLVAVSQLPMQYILALKAINPLALALDTSHEHLNRYHRVLGRLVYGLLVLHVVLYNVFFLASGLWVARFFAPVVFVGVVASFLMHALTGTAMRSVRRWSYRVFFVTHLVAAMAVPPLIFFHAPSARLYLIESVVVFIIDLAVRKTTAVTTPATLEAIPGTDLVRLTATLPAAKTARYRLRPASHVYLSVPPEGRPNANPTSPAHFVFDFLYNPFTVASTSAADTISLVFRRNAGPMTSHLSSSAGEDAPKLPLTIEGPYGAASLSFPSFLTGAGGPPHRVLLFAGGVGATFILPIYNTLLADYPASKVRFIWAIRAAADATWAVSLNESSGTSLLDDENVQLFLTGDMGTTTSPANGSGIELGDLRRGNTKRPDIRKIVDDTFRLGQGETVAVLVCGPTEMARDVRNAVRPWVMKGRNVWFHDEAFGW